MMANKPAIFSLLKSKRLPFLGAMTITLIGGSYLGQYVVFTTRSKEPVRPDSLVVARQRDRSREWDEWALGIKSLRRRLAGEARGHVLESSLGAGRNFPHLDWSHIMTTSSDPDTPQRNKSAAPLSWLGIFSFLARSSPNAGSSGQAAASNERRMDSFTGVDLSTDMMALSMEKLAQTLPRLAQSTPATTRSADATKGVEIAYLAGKIRLVKLDSQLALPPAPSPIGDLDGAKGGLYDTIIQSFGLCSVADPGAVIANMARAIKPQTGKIVLLEHGKGWSIINGYLDRSASSHFKNWGCWHNKDIEAIVRSAAKTIPGLEVVTVERPKFLHLGTLVWIELKMV